MIDFAKEFFNQQEKIRMEVVLEMCCCFFCERDLKFIHYNNFRVESKMHVVVLTLSRGNRKTGRDIKIGIKRKIKHESFIVEDHTDTSTWTNHNRFSPIFLHLICARYTLSCTITT